MIYELRTYRATPGGMPALLKRFETRTLKIWERLGIRQLGFWRTTVDRHTLSWSISLSGTRSRSGSVFGEPSSRTANGRRSPLPRRPTGQFSRISRAPS